MGFKVIRDFIKDKEEKGATGIESARQTGLNAMFMSEEDQNNCEYHGGKIKVRLKDDDGNIYYHGYVDDTDFSCELFLNWGMGYAGTTSLDLSKTVWDDETNNREHPYPSKDGKWVSYMS